MINYQGIIKARAKETAKIKTRPTPKPEQKVKQTPEIKTIANWKKWGIVVCVIIPWLIYSSIDYGEASIGNFFLILVVTMIMSAIWPINHLTAVSIVLLLHPINILVRPVYFGYDPFHSVLTPIFEILIFAGNALAVSFICKWKLDKKTK